jgi:hypothetical protein
MASFTEWERFCRRTAGMERVYMALRFKQRYPVLLSDQEVERLVATLILHKKSPAIKAALVELLKEVIADTVIAALEEVEK